MHVLIATTGVLSAGPVVEFTAHLAGDSGRVTVTTVIGVPRTFLEDIHAEGWHPLDDDGAGSETDESLIARYVDERGRRLTEPIVIGLSAAGITAEAVYLEGEDPAAAISQLADSLNVDVVVVGATRQIFEQAAWESVSARIMIESRRPVLVVPPPPKEPLVYAEEAT